MGCGSSSLKGDSDPAGGSKEDKERSYAIDKQIDDDAKKLRRECKILLLGMFSPAALPLSLLEVLTSSMNQQDRVNLERVRSSNRWSWSIKMVTLEMKWCCSGWLFTRVRALIHSLLYSEHFLINLSRNRYHRFSSRTRFSIEEIPNGADRRSQSGALHVPANPSESRNLIYSNLRRTGIRGIDYGVPIRRRYLFDCESSIRFKRRFRWRTITRFRTSSRQSLAWSDHSECTR